MRRRDLGHSLVRGLGSLGSLASLGGAGCAVQRPTSTLLDRGRVLRDSAATFRALTPGAPLESIGGPGTRWAAAVDEPAQLSITAEGLRIASVPRRRAWVSPRLPVAALDEVVPGQIEELSWDGAVTVERRFFIVCEFRFAGEPGAVLVEATPFDLQVFHDPERPSGGRSESLSLLLGDGRQHFWRVRLADGHVEVYLDGSAIWSLDGPRGLARCAFGETRTDDEHGGSMLMRDLVYVRRPAHGDVGTSA